MTRWRLLFSFLLFLVVGIPLLMPVLELFRTSKGWQSLGETERLADLAGNSILLVGGTLLIALPLGMLGAVLLFRTDLPGRSAWRFLSVLSLFVPVPLVTAAWQMALHSLFGWGQPWSQGLLPAIWIHAMAALPWVIILVGLGLSWVEPELEEDALTTVGPWRVFWSVTLPRAWPALLLAAVWATVMTLGEITVTDMMKVRTFSEEVYLEFNGEAGAAGAVTVSLPAFLLMGGITLLAVNHWRRAVPPRQVLLREPLLFPLGWVRWPWFVVVLVTVLLLVGVPLAGLIDKAGLRYASPQQPGPPSWDALLMFQEVALALRQDGRLLLNSILLGVATGIVTGFLALILCWLARGSRWFEALIWGLAAALWAVSGPVLGIGVLDTILALLDLPGSDLFGLLLYRRPSPLPNLWVCSLRFLPVALAVLWPLVRLIPPELEEAAMLDGAGPWQRFCRVVLPLMKGPLAWTILGVAVLTLGELSASKLVTTPGFTPLAHHVFMQMHASADTKLAALCLVLLLVVAVGGVVAALSRNLLRGSLAGR